MKIEEIKDILQALDDKTELINQNVEAINLKLNSLKDLKNDQLSQLRLIKKNKNKIYNHIVNCSQLNLNLISPYLIDLISSDVQYTFITPKYEYIYDQNKQKRFHIALLVPKEMEKDLYRLEDFQDPSIIVIDNNHKQSKKIPLTHHFYDKDLNLNLNKCFVDEHGYIIFDTKKLDKFTYDIIKGFIDDIVEYRLNKPVNEINEQEITSIYQNYTEKIKTIGGKNEKNI